MDFGFENRPEKMCSPMYGVHGRDGGMGVVGVPGAGGTLIYISTFLNTWEPDPSRVVWQRLAEKAVCCHADIQRIYSTRNGGKKCRCVEGGR